MGTETGTTTNASDGGQRILMDKDDSWVWKGKEIAVFTVKSTYNILKQGVQGSDREVFREFWRLKAQPSSHLTAWRVLEDKTTSKANLVRRGVCITTIMCCLCGEEEETTAHLFCTCKVV